MRHQRTGLPSTSARSIGICNSINFGSMILRSPTITTVVRGGNSRPAASVNPATFSYVFPLLIDAAFTVRAANADAGLADGRKHRITVARVEEQGARARILKERNGVTVAIGKGRIGQQC
jgi:hypothetical protein